MHHLKSYTVVWKFYIFFLCATDAEVIKLSIIPRGFRSTGPFIRVCPKRAYIGLFLITILAISTIGLPFLRANAQTQDLLTVTKKLALLTVEFSEHKHNPNLFDETKAVQSLKYFYNSNSFGKMSLNVTVSPRWYVLDKSIYDYDFSCQTDSRYGSSASERPAYDFVKDSLQAAVRDMDLSQFDYIMILYPKYNSVSEVPGCSFPSNQWKVMGRDSSSIVTVRESVFFSSKNDNLWVIEYLVGNLLGLPDMSLDDRGTTIFWDTMGRAQGRDSNSTMFGGFARMQLHWLDDKYIKIIDYGQKATITIQPLERPPTITSVAKIPITEQQYYLIEQRSRGGIGANLPQDASEGIVITYVNDESNHQRVQWISHASKSPVSTAKDLKDIAFRQGESFENGYVGSIKITAKNGSNYQLLIDRTNINPPIINQKYSYKGISYSFPSQWNTKTVGSNIFAAEEIPVLGLQYVKDAVIMVGTSTVKGRLAEDYDSNLLFAHVSCKETGQRYLILNGMKAMELTSQCLPNDYSAVFMPLTVKTYLVTYSEKQTTGRYLDKSISLSFIADGPDSYSTHIPDFEQTTRTLQVANSTDIRTVEEKTIGLKEQVRNVTNSSAQKVQVSFVSNSNISNIKVDVERNEISIKANARDENKVLRIPYDTYLKAPYLITLNEQHIVSPSIVADDIAKTKYVQLALEKGDNAISIKGTNSVWKPAAKDERNSKLRVIATGADGTYNVKVINWREGVGAISKLVIKVSGSDIITGAKAPLGWKMGMVDQKRVVFSSLGYPLYPGAQIKTVIDGSIYSRIYWAAYDREGNPIDAGETKITKPT